MQDCPLDFNVLLFDDYETLDAIGPAEIIGRMGTQFKVDYFSEHGGTVVSGQNLRTYTKPFSKMNKSGILLIPGGLGVRSAVEYDGYVSLIRELATEASHVLSVCTGAALLAKTGLLDGRSATTNKIVFDWVSSLGKNINWRKRARWVVDGKFYTASGIMAGMDMVLGFVSDLYGYGAAKSIADFIEYVWNSDPDNDPFGLG